MPRWCLMSAELMAGSRQRWPFLSLDLLRKRSQGIADEDAGVTTTHKDCAVQAAARVAGILACLLVTSRENDFCGCRQRLDRVQQVPQDVLLEGGLAINSAGPRRIVRGGDACRWRS
jgi:hypothetical protein